MALDVASFVVRFPEFLDVSETEIGEAAIEQAILDAKPFCSQRIWAGKYEAGVMYKAAHLLSMAPFGESARLDTGDSTIYEVVFCSMKKALPVRMAVG
ncbi:MAG TPA: DUF4054 domain-containing protein [Nitrososphaera sp.]|jgi:hypothetical protein|nr:DUF4054 domain-containing protein [Nitrososphaera sp.]